MALQLDHTIVPVRDHVAAARRMANLFGIDYDGGTWGHFAPLKVNDTLTLDFDTRADPQSPHGNHYAFLASDAEFDAILARVKAEGVVFGSGPSRAARVDGEINHRHGGRGFYFECPDGHLWEVITHTYVTD